MDRSPRCGISTAEGQTLYFDSTPAAGKISHRAHEAHVEVGQAYSREGGGELSVVGQLPIAKIIPVTKLFNPGQRRWLDENCEYWTRVVWDGDRSKADTR